MSCGTTLKGGHIMMTKTKKILMAILVIAMTLVALSQPVNAASATSPYCRISYDTSMGCNTVKYYSYIKGIAQYDASRLVKFYDGKVLLGTSETVVTTNHKLGTNPSWITDGSFLIWQEADADLSLCARGYSDGINRTIATGVTSISLNAESMVETVSFADGTSKSIKDLLGSTSSAPAPTPVPVPVPTPAPVTTTPPAIKEWTDSVNRDHFKFGKNELIVDGKKIYLNDYLISELCNSGVRFVGIDNQNRVYLYEDRSACFYRFNTKNIFKPIKMKFATGAKLLSVEKNSNGYITKVVTSAGTFSIKQLVADKKWYPKKSYVMNKHGYCVYYMSESSKTYTLTIKGNNLYLGKKLIVKGISRKTDSFGFKGKYIRYIKNGYDCQVKISNPKKVTILKKGVKKYTYSKKDGTVKKAK